MCWCLNWFSSMELYLKCLRQKYFPKNMELISEKLGYIVNLNWIPLNKKSELRYFDYYYLQKQIGKIN